VIAVVVVVGVLGLLNLLFTFGVVRRLRDHTKLLDMLYDIVGAGGQGGSPGNFPPKGERVGDFAATAVDGTPVSRDVLADATVVAFMSPGCPGCQEQLPELLAWAKNQDRERVLVVVDARSEAPDGLVGKLLPVARVIVEDDRTPVADAFQVRSVPAFCVVGAGGEMRSVVARVSRLPVAERA